MPFVLRTVEPKYLSRTSLHDENGLPKVKDDELLAVTNCTLSNALRQLASLVVLANDIFSDLTVQLNGISDRSKCLQLKINRVNDRLELFDPKKVPVPEGDLSAFALRKEHFNSKPVITSGLFTEDTRPKCLKDLYQKAGLLDGQGGRSPRVPGRRSPLIQCTPVLGARRRRLREKVDVEIETRLPAAIEELRKWTSTEALGDPTVAPDGLPRVTANLTLIDGEASNVVSSDDEEPLDHKLPSPEEQFSAIASKFPPEVIPIDTSGRGFDRMCMSRRSLLHMDTSCDRTQNGDAQTVKRRTRSRKPRGKRRNTITGTDQKEIRDAIAGDTTSPMDEAGSPDSGAVIRSHSSDLLKKSPFDIQTKKSHFNSLKEWGRSRLRLISRSPSDSGRDSSRTEKPKSNKSPTTVLDIDDINTYETVTMRRKRNANKQQDRKISHERNNSYSSSERSMSMPISMPITGALSLAVKLRESNAGRRRRAATGSTKEEPHSSSGNWSASSESGRTSIGSEITSTTAAPRSSTSAATSSNSLNVPHGPPSSIVSRRRFLNTSGSGSVTSEGTLTPDIIHDLHDDMETSSEFSCDTEGYYTSFHMDSGLKTLKEEEISLPITPLHTTNTFTNSSGNQTVLSAENEYELFGKGSTSTTTSSAGTVCTTLLAAGSNRSLVLGPTVPERKSSLSKLNKSRSSSTNSNITLDKSSNSAGSNSEKTNTIKRNTLPKSTDNLLKLKNNQETEIVQETVTVVIHQTQLPNTGSESPDSGHNTSSSPVDDSLSSAHGGKISCGGSELDYSESSDLEGIDRIERIRVKTTINSSRIPSMCVITPHNSDDESSNSSKQESTENNTQLDKNNQNPVNDEFDNDIVEAEIKNRISNRPKLDLPPQETDLDTLVFNDTVIDTHVNSIESSPNNIQTGEDEIPATKQSVIANILSKKSKNKKIGVTTKCIDSHKPSSKSSFTPLNNLMCRLKDVFPQKLSLKKGINRESQVNESLYTDNGEYVTIADVRNNNQKININKASGVYYTNDVVKRNLQTVLSGKLQETEYVSLNELPSNISTDSPDISGENNDAKNNVLETFTRQGARVTLDSNGKVIYSSDSLKRRKGAHTTFEPGPFIKDSDVAPTVNTHQENTPLTSCGTATVDVLKNTTILRSSPVTVVSSSQENHPKTINSTRPLSPQLGKLVIRAPNAGSSSIIPTSEIVRMPPTNIVTPSSIIRPMSPRSTTKGAYVNIQDAEGISLSPTKDNDPDYRHSSADRVHQNSPIHPVLLPHPDNLQVIPENKRGQQILPNQNYQTGKMYSHDDLTGQVSPVSFGYLPPNKQGNSYWTLQPKKGHIIPDNYTFQRSVTPDITRGLYSYPETNNQQNILHLPPNSIPQYSTNPPINVNPQNEANYLNEFSTQTHHGNIRNMYTAQQDFIPNINCQPSYNSLSPIEMHKNVSAMRQNNTGHDSESLKMSPIDPRNTGKFHSSTPTRIDNSKDSSNILQKITSPVKSSMSNEELYAVIHKSKKKMNIKSPPLDRAGSPALSVNSLSPGSSESSITGRITPVKLPETGYLNDARARHSWSPNIQDNNTYVSDVNRIPESYSPRQGDSGPRQSWACADRLRPPPQTSRLDFKKLLLQHGVKLNFQHLNKPPAKVSAVERLKLSKESTSNTPSQQIADMSNINILDLSGSPKIYANRRIMRIANNAAPCSPSRTSTLIKEHKTTPKILLSPKTQWRFSSPRSDVLSSPIPEAFNEDESPNDKDQRQIATDFSTKISENILSSKSLDSKPNFRRNLIPTIKENIMTDDQNFTELDESISPMKNNIFMKTQENNFTKQEQQALNTFGQPHNKYNLHEKMSRAEILQAQKAQFLSQEISNPMHFKNPLIPSQFIRSNRNEENQEKCPSPPTLETAL